MELPIFFTDKIKAASQYHLPQFPAFLQKMSNRICFGSVRYDPPNADQGYMNLILKEFKAYKKSGNCEHLYNLANYCYLESIAPQNKKFHFKEDERSVRRDARDN